jgi:SAM-dependent methyltransferase
MVPGEDELSRLRMLEAINDPTTFRRLDAIGVAAGWQCLEVGAGGGSVARNLAARVGIGGRVVAADMDPRFLGTPDFADLEVVTHDITSGPVPPGAFDLVHCRAVLAHIADLEGAVANLVASARPGGIVFVEEPDYCAMAPCDPHHPGAGVFARYVDGMRNGARMDPNAGRRTDAAMRTAGLEIQSSEGATAITYGGDYRARYRKLTMEIARPMAIASGSWSETSLQTLLDLFDDQTFGYVDNLWIGIVGRKPLE